MSIEEAEPDNTEIRIKSVEPILVAAIDGDGEVPDADRDIDRLYEYLYSRGLGDKIVGSTIALFYSHHAGRYSVTVPIKEPLPGDQEIKITRLPQITCLSTMHTNHEISLDESFSRIRDYEEQHGINWQFPVREIYNPDPKNPGKYITEIQVPIDPKKPK